VSNESVILIGAGLAGLSAGCYAQMNGYQSHIFEHHAAPGGVAAAWQREGYTIDGGIHFITGHRPGTALHELYRELGAARDDSFVDMTTYCRFTDEASGRSLVVTPDLDRLAGDMEAVSPEDVAIIDDLIAGARAMRGMDVSGLGMNQPPELAGRLTQLRQLWQMRDQFKYMTKKYAAPVAEYAQAIHHPWLRQVVENLFLPEVPAWFLFRFLGMLADGQLGLLAAGCADFVRAIEKRYKDLGGQVTYNARVNEVLVKDDRAVGVRLAERTRHYAETVVSAADGYGTIFGMLRGRYVDDDVRQRYESWKLTRPMVMVSFGVAREFADEPWLSFVNLWRPFRLGTHSVSSIMVRIFNYSTRFAPKGKTVVQAAFDTEWEWWNELRRNRSRYESEKERVAAKILKSLEDYYPGISRLVEVTDVATPHTTWRYTLNHHGAYMGWLPTPEALKSFVPRTLPGLEDFYMAGQWVMPGGGVPPCLYSGRHVVQLMCLRDYKPFSTPRHQSG